MNIEDRVWVSCNTVILPEVTVREGSVIAAGAVVTMHFIRTSNGCNESSS